MPKISDMDRCKQDARPIRTQPILDRPAEQQLLAYGNNRRDHDDMPNRSMTEEQGINAPIIHTFLRDEPGQEHIRPEHHSRKSCSPVHKFDTIREIEQMKRISFLK